MFFQVIEQLEVKEISLFLHCIRPHEIFVGFCAHLPCALQDPKGQQRQISFRAKGLK